MNWKNKLEEISVEQDPKKWPHWQLYPLHSDDYSYA
jgi:hypothetical protein